MEGKDGSDSQNRRRRKAGVTEYRIGRVVSSKNDRRVHKLGCIRQWLRQKMQRQAFEPQSTIHLCRDCYVRRRMLTAVRRSRVVVLWTIRRGRLRHTAGLSAEGRSNQSDRQKQHNSSDHRMHLNILRFNLRIRQWLLVTVNGGELPS